MVSVFGITLEYKSVKGKLGIWGEMFTIWLESLEKYMYIKETLMGPPRGSVLFFLPIWGPYHVLLVLPTLNIVERSLVVPHVFSTSLKRKPFLCSKQRRYRENNFTKQSHLFTFHYCFQDHQIERERIVEI